MLKYFTERRKIVSESTLETELNYSPKPNINILSNNNIRFLKTIYRYSTVPMTILDSSLRILWKNGAASFLFKRGLSIIGEYMTRFFFPYLDDEKSSDIYRSITSRESGFSWRGRLETGGKDTLTVITNTMIFPIFDDIDKDDKPIGYLAIFDNVTEENKTMLKNTFLSLLEASKLKDNDTGQHIQRVNRYSESLALSLFDNPGYSQINREFIENIGFLASMHDVGKIGIPDDILNKEGPLDEREWKIMKEHTINGAYILDTYPNLMAKQIALFHHERWDGNGYPYGINGDLIPISARIVAVADVYDALRMKRSYKDPLTHQKACEIIEEESGNHFEPEIVKCFLKLESAFSDIYNSLAD